MKSLNAKLVMSAVAVAMLATPALAASAHKRDPMQRPLYNTLQPSQFGPSGTYIYPNGAARTGTGDSVQSGAEFNEQVLPDIHQIY